MFIGGGIVWIDEMKEELSAMNEGSVLNTTSASSAESAANSECSYAQPAKDKDSTKTLYWLLMGS